MLMHPKKILIIRRDNIGDLVCTTPAIAALRKHYPDAEIGALVNSYNAEVLRGNPNLNYVFVYQKLKHSAGLFGRFKALMQRLALIKTLRRWKPEVTILAKASYDRYGLSFARQVGAKNVIGYVPEGEGMAKVLPDIRLETPGFIAMHEVEAVAGLLVPLGIHQPMGPMQVFPESAAVSALQNRLPHTGKRIALHISAREPERRWGIDNFIALTKCLLQAEPERQVLLFWSPGKADDPHHPGDDESAKALIKAVASDRLMPMPTQSLTELIAALSLCDIFIGTDGGAMHLAAALNKNVLAMFENKPDKLNHWYPWQANGQIISSDQSAAPDICNIPLAAVVASLEAI